ncbi:MAG: YncE family protein [Gammaproteobacteria bacterium]|nr:YncE family protein [Gammaproteobacteria bacterium]
MTCVLNRVACPVLLGALILLSIPARGEILAIMNYESKTPDSLKALKLSGPQEREEGLAIIDVDPNSDSFGKWLWKMPLPADLVAHHIFYDRTMTKGYLTALGKGELRVIDFTRNPYRIKKIDVPQCKVGEDVVFSEDNKTWYLTCMGSATVVVGDVATDKIKENISIPGTYPHGLAVHSGIDRVLVTSTIQPDLQNPDEVITVIQASTNKVLGQHKLSNKPSPSGVAPVEILFVPGSNPPVAYITNMFGNSLWAAAWDANKQDFDVSQIFDFTTIGAGVPLEIYFNRAADRMYLTTANPGKFHIFDMTNGPMKPTLLKTLDAGEGAHHVGITKDEKYAFVQNALLNLPGMSDGSITVVDLQAEKVVASMNTLKDRGYNPNSFVLLPEWNHLAGH